jgi:hypothetical protein
MVVCLVGFVDIVKSPSHSFAGICTRHGATFSKYVNTCSQQKRTPPSARSRREADDDGVAFHNSLKLASATSVAQNSYETELLTT